MSSRFTLRKFFNFSKFLIPSIKDLKAFALKDSTINIYSQKITLNEAEKSWKPNYKFKNKLYEIQIMHCKPLCFSFSFFSL